MNEVDWSSDWTQIHKNNNKTWFNTKLDHCFKLTIMATYQRDVGYSYLTG